uniref:(northern house mosquito) hypothetical protein n=1 Tax=Culex pipiens TaxID=7175 RepID=A0A8D8A8R9_CULPI
MFSMLGDLRALRGLTQIELSNGLATIGETLRSICFDFRSGRWGCWDGGSGDSCDFSCSICLYVVKSDLGLRSIAGGGSYVTDMSRLEPTIPDVMSFRMWA